MKNTYCEKKVPPPTPPAQPTLPPLPESLQRRLAVDPEIAVCILECSIKLAIFG